MWEIDDGPLLVRWNMCVLIVDVIDLGAAYGTAKSGVGICSMGVLKPDLIFKSIVPIIMAGILGIYGLIVAVILNGKGKIITYSFTNNYFSRYQWRRSYSCYLQIR